MNYFSRSSLLRYGVAASCIGLSLLLKLQIEQGCAHAFQSFFSTITISAPDVGHEAGLLALALSAVI